MASTVKLNNDCEALPSVINYDRKCDATIWSVNQMSSCDVFIIQATGSFTTKFTSVKNSSVRCKTVNCTA
jgi:hypothetical protein